MRDRRDRLGGLDRLGVILSSNSRSSSSRTPTIFVVRTSVASNCDSPQPATGSSRNSVTRHHHSRHAHSQRQSYCKQARTYTSSSFAVVVVVAAAAVFNAATGAAAAATVAISALFLLLLLFTH